MESGEKTGNSLSLEHISCEQKDLFEGDYVENKRVDEG